jgi:hypothetical protein
MTPLYLWHRPGVHYRRKVAERRANDQAAGRKLARALAVVGAAVVCSPSLGLAGVPRFSNHGVLVPLTSAERHAMVTKHRSPDIYRLATVGRFTFFRFGDSGLCFGAKRDFSMVEVTPQSVPLVFGGYVCRSRLTTVMDMSIHGASRADPKMHLEVLAGIAADNVSKIQLLTSDGHVATTVPVIRNVYSLGHVPKDVVGLRGVTTTGTLLPVLP